jgi:hypothetical protein
MNLVRNSICFLAIMSSAYGADVSKSSTVLEDTQISKEKKDYNIRFETTFGSSLHKPSDEDHILSNDISILPTIDLPMGFTLVGSLGANKNFKGERKTEITDGLIGVSRKIRRFGDLTLSGSATSIIPLSENSKKNTQLRTAITLKPTLSYKLRDDINLSYAPSAKVYFHKYKNALTGASNTNYQLKNIAALSYSGFEALTLIASASYSRNITYRGNTTDAYAFAQIASYTTTENTSVSIGHALGSSPLKANGIDQEIKLYDERKSSIFAGFSFTY